MRLAMLFCRVREPPFCTFKWAVAALAGTAQNC
jgi:hypothetical protein